MRGIPWGTHKRYRRHDAEGAARLRLKGVSELQADIDSVRRELAATLDHYRELGLRVSLLSGERRVLLRNLARTRQYLESAHLELPPLQEDLADLDTAAPEPAEGAPQARSAVPKRRSRSRRKPRWHGAVGLIAAHTVPAMRLERELARVQQELDTSRDACWRLELQAERLMRERDAAVADLEWARAGALRAARATAPQAGEADAGGAPEQRESRDEDQRAEIQRLTAQLAAAVSEADTLTQSHRDAETRLHQLQAASNDLQIGLLEREDEISALRAERDRLQGELEQLEGRVASLQQALDSAEASGEGLAAERERLREELASTNSRDAARITELHSRGEALEAELARVRGDRERLEDELKAAAALQAEAEQLHRDLEAKLEAERSSVAQQERQLGELREQNQQQRSELEGLAAQLAAAVSEADALAQSHRDAEAQLHQVQAASNDLQIGLLEREDEIEALRAERDRLQGENQQLDGRIAALQQALDSAEASGQALAAEWERLEGELQAAAARQAEADQLQGDLQAASNDLQIGLNERDDAIEALRNERDRLAGEMTQLDGRVSVLQQALDSAETSGQALASELDSVRRQAQSDHEAMAQRAAQLEGALAKAAAIRKKGRKRRAALTVALREQMRQLDLAARRAAALESRKQQLLADTRQLKQRRLAAEQSRNEVQQQAQAARVELDAVVAQIKTLQTALEAAEARAEASQAESEQLRAALEQQRDGNAALETELAERRSDEQRLQAEADGLTQRVAALEAELAAERGGKETLSNEMAAAVEKHSARERQDTEKVRVLERQLEGLQSQLVVAHRQLETLELSLAEALQARSVTSSEAEGAGRASEDRAPPSAIPLTGVAVSEALAQAGAAPAIAEPHAATRTARRRRVRRAAAAAVLVAGLLWGVIYLRDLIWGEPPPADDAQDLSSSSPPAAEVEQQTVAEAASTETASTETVSTETVSALPQLPAATQPDSEGGAGAKKELPPYLKSLAQRSGPQAASVAGAASDDARRSASDAASAELATLEPPAPAKPQARPDSATRKESSLPPYLRTMARRTTKPAQGGAQVQAHLGEGAPSRALRRLCEGSAADSHLCSETELAFMKDTVINLGNGVKYKVIDNGTGRSPTADDKVIVRYSGLLPDGTEFGSADASGEAEAFRLNQAIPGLREVLQYMEEGAKWEVYVPTEMAFPEPGPWGGQEVLFRIELLAVGDDDAGSSAPDDARRVSERQSDEQTYWQAGPSPDGAAAAQEEETNAEPAVPTNPRRAAEAFLEQVGAQEDVTTLPSGLRYKVLKSGDGSGRSPSATDTVVVKYRTMLPDGREIGRSDAATPVIMGKLLPGWQEALQQMTEGAQWELYMPPSLASRGTRGRGVAGMQPLICQLELVSISQAADTPADQ